MKQTLSNVQDLLASRLAAFASGRTILLTLVLAIGIFGGVTAFGPACRLFSLVQAAGVNMPDLTPGLSPAQLDAFWQALGPDGRQTYRQAVLLDFVTPLTMAAALVTLASYAWSRVVDGSWWVWIAFVPALFVLGEWGENTFYLLTNLYYPDYPVWWATAGATFTTFKFYVNYLGIAVVLVGWILLAVVRVRRD